MSVHYMVFDITEPKGAEPFAVLRADTEDAAGGKCEATVMSLHWTKDEAEAAAAQLAGNLN